ncbi:hypothetical protein KSS87_011516 [Heliosperma pusillum]|nr:hypothetical protein KSS87_011516 [Heliosperma pusillum]
MGNRGLTVKDEVESHMVDDGLKNRRFLVEYNIANNEAKCACKLFERRGFFCRHVIWVWKGRKVYKIPEPYILTRWTKKSYRPIVYDENGKVIEDFDEVDIRKTEMSNVWSEIYKTVGLLDSAPQEIDILPPHKAKNKGSWKKQMSPKEKAVRKREKRKRRCGNCKSCKRWVNHNNITCNLPFVEDLPSDDDERETDDEEFLEAEKDGMRRQLEEKQYTEADIDGQFIAGVKALKKSYTRVNTSIPDNWSAVLEPMDLMHAYKNTLRDDFLEGESSVQGSQNKRPRRE